MPDEYDHHLFISVLENSKHSLSLVHTDPNIEFTNNFPGLISNPTTHQQPFGLNDNILDNPFPQLSRNSDNFPGLFIHHDQDNNMLPRVTSNGSDNGDRKRKAMEISSPANSSPQGSANGIGRKNVAGRGKRAKGDEEKKEEKPREFIHVRAKRGQATDSHSLAERVRRGKINERLRCLQDIVPGCYKTMGMALMLDEIINYVQSLQNQVEFLSMKLSAASTFCDFNSEIDAIETMQRAKAFEALMIQNEASSRLNNSAQFAPSGLDFGYYPQLPHNI